MVLLFPGWKNKITCKESYPYRWLNVYRSFGGERKCLACWHRREQCGPWEWKREFLNSFMQWVSRENHYGWTYTKLISVALLLTTQTCGLWEPDYSVKLEQWRVCVCGVNLLVFFALPIRLKWVNRLLYAQG